jgi:hypothetical protein
MFPLTAYLCKNLTSYTASVVRPPEWWPHLRGLPLADLNPTSREPIHLLIEADLYDRRRGHKNRTWLDHIWSSQMSVRALCLKLCHIASPNAKQIRRCGNLGRMRRFPPKLQNLRYVMVIVRATGDCHIDILTGLD